MKDNKTVLVTGCAGFIGSNFVSKLREEQPETHIVGVDDFSTGRKDSVNKDITFFEGSIENQKLLNKIFNKHKPSHVIHFAALPRVSYSVEEPILTSRVNILGTATLLEISRQNNVKRFVYSSSSSVYGGAKILPTKESDNYPDPKSPYAAQKLTGEQYCKIYSEIFKLDTVCLRYFTAFGPGQYGNSAYSTVIAGWLESLYFPDKKIGFIEGDGSQSRDFCYIDNIIKANILAMDKNGWLNGECVNIAHGESTTLNDVKLLIEKLTSKRIVLEKRPSRIGDVRHTQADISKAKELLGYKPNIMLEDGLERTINWYESRLGSS